MATVVGVDVDVAVVGAGPAGTTVAARLARRGFGVVVLERAPSWHWRAGGVFSSPAAVAALARAGLDAPTLGAVARPIPAMRFETPGGAVVRLTYGTERGGPPAVGFDRSALDPALEAMAAQAGATIRRGVTVRAVQLPVKDGPVILALGAASGPESLRCRVVVGADGSHSVVGAAAGVTRPTRLPPRVGLSHHVADPRPGDADPGPDARLRAFAGGYVGLAPVPGGRRNVGIVLGPAWRERLARDGAAPTARWILAAIPRTDDDPVDWAAAEACEPIAGAVPLGARVTRRAGPGWFLVGDAAGFLDPFTGEGLHRAVVSSELAAGAIAAGLSDRSALARAALAYDRAMRRRFAAKDVVSLLVQAFVAGPAALEYAARRLESRADVRATMGLVMGDLIPARHGLDPRFLAALLAP